MAGTTTGTVMTAGTVTAGTTATATAGTGTRMLTREALEAALGFRVVDFSKYVVCFTHKSATHLTRGPSYERLKFLGDAVINFVIAKHLFDQFPRADEGYLTRVRISMRSYLPHLARCMRLHTVVMMSSEGLDQGLNASPRIREEVFAGLVGCVYLDLGMTSAKSLVVSAYSKHIDFDEVLEDTNYKDGLMRYAQTRGLPPPAFQCEARGPVFHVRLCLEGRAARGSGPTKKRAEQDAARDMLAQVGRLTEAGAVEVGRGAAGGRRVGRRASAPPPPYSKRDLEAALCLRTLDFSKYATGFTHKSAANLTNGPSYERFEFVGDAVLGIIATKLLFDRFPDADEGFLTRVRTRLVCGEHLARLAWGMGLQRFVVMNQRGMQRGFNTNQRILEDVFESLIGCIYLDLGMAAARDYVLAVFDRFVDFQDIVRDTNYTDGLTRFAHSRGRPPPAYDATSGDASRFVVDATMGGLRASGEGRSKKHAEQVAARNLLGMVGAISPHGDVRIPALDAPAEILGDPQ